MYKRPQNPALPALLSLIIRRCNLHAPVPYNSNRSFTSSHLRHGVMLMTQLPQLYRGLKPKGSEQYPAPRLSNEHTVFMVRCGLHKDFGIGKLTDWYRQLLAGDRLARKFVMAISPTCYLLRGSCFKYCVQRSITRTGKEQSLRFNWLA